jgi:TctA family transporter
LRQSFNIHWGNIFVFFQRPISLVFMGVIILSIVSPLIKMIYLSYRRKSN